MAPLDSRGGTLFYTIRGSGSTGQIAMYRPPLVLITFAGIRDALYT